MLNLFEVETILTCYYEKKGVCGKIWLKAEAQKSVNDISLETEFSFCPEQYIFLWF